MSRALITATREHLADAGLLDGYAVKYNRWTDEDENGAGDFVVFRMEGSGGRSNRLLKQPDLGLIVVAEPTTVGAAQDRIDAIADYLREPGAPAGVVKYDVLGNPRGPTYLTNGRGVFQLTVRAYVE